MASEGRAEPGGGVTVRRVPTEDQRSTLARMLDAVQLPDDTRVWVQATYEDGVAVVTVRAGAGGVTGEATAEASVALRDALERALKLHGDEARADLKQGWARTLSAAMAGRNEG